ncbi:hypothetical protein QCE42_04590 [Caballeronia sp. LZ050]|uniref:hypothetical protein n=1 Tax=Caballeronia sp. LZ050 TaxID=3038570 RepID=UPI0028548522|nr:hypothetical protein [Caballeronia sp. LZ050]MDR5854147.1 hypothetical protein [Caballeronia sp. LZ050]
MDTGKSAVDLCLHILASLIVLGEALINVELSFYMLRWIQKVASAIETPYKAGFGDG